MRSWPCCPFHRRHGIPDLLCQPWGNGVPYLEGHCLDPPGQYGFHREPLEDQRLSNGDRPVRLRMGEATTRHIRAARREGGRGSVPPHPAVDVVVTFVLAMAVELQLVGKIGPGLSLLQGFEPTKSEVSVSSRAVKGIRRAVGLDDVADRLTNRHVGLEAVARGSVRGRRKAGDRNPAGDHEQSPASLGHAVIDRIDDVPHHLVVALGESRQKEIEFAFSSTINHSGHILEGQVSGLELLDQAEILTWQRVASFVVVARVLATPKNGKTLTWRTAEKECEVARAESGL